MKIVYAFMNSYTQGKSGGDMAFIEIFKRIKNIRLVIVTSAMGKKLCLENKLKADYLLTTCEKNFTNILHIYSQRIFKGSMLSIKPNQEDVFYATSDALPDVLPLFFLKTQYPKIKWMQKIYHLIPKERFFSHWSQKLSLFLIKKYADTVIVAEDNLKKKLFTKNVSKDKIKVNYLGVNFNFLQKIKPSKISYEGVFLGRLHVSKGIFSLIEIWERVASRFPKAKLAVIGQGHKKIIDKLRQKIRESNIEKNIDLLGYLKDDQAYSLIKSAKLFVFPSHEEGFGLAILESLACSTSVVAYDLSCYHQDIKNKISLVPKFDEKLFAQVIISQLKKNKKVKLTNNFLYKFSWDQTAKNEKELIA